jgi:hypothetical protein
MRIHAARTEHTPCHEQRREIALDAVRWLAGSRTYVRYPDETRTTGSRASSRSGGDVIRQ